jgi:hypothetical protein
VSIELIVYGRDGGIEVWKRSAEEQGAAALVEVRHRPRKRIIEPEAIPPGGKRVFLRGRWIILDAEGARFFDEGVSQIGAVREIRALIAKHFGEDEAAWWCKARHERQRIAEFA